MNENGLQKKKSVIEWAESITSAIAVILLIFVFVVQPANVDGSSMLPTLKNGDKILLRSAFYTPQKGDVIVIDSYNTHGKTLVKRVIATGGDTVQIDDATGELYVNGALQLEGYITPPTYTGNIETPLTVPQGEVFVMGDNRPGSLDSRYSEVGMIDERDIMGGVFFRLIPRTGKVN